jgi:pimeloyl-ACP methyl ester carboxylesterase
MRIGVPPYPPPMRAKVMTQRAILAKYGGEVYGSRRGGLPAVLRTLWHTSEYGWLDRINFFRGIFASMDLLWPQIMTIDLFRQAPRLEVPVYFLEGRHDYEAPSILAQRYYDELVAPRKQLIWFERSAHFVNVEEADAFNRFFVDELLAEPRPRSPMTASTT